MVHTGIGTDRKIRRLAPAERWVYLAGVLALAAQSPERGVLLVGEGIAVTVEDIAEQAGVTRSLAASALRKLRELGLVKPQEDAEVVHNWDEWQPAPKKDPTAAERKRRQRERDRDAGVTVDVTRDGHGDMSRGHTGEVEEKGRTTDVAVLPNAADTEKVSAVPLSSAKADQRPSQVFTEWVRVTGRDPARTLFDDKRKRKVKAALRDADRACAGDKEAALAEVLGAVRGVWKSDYHRENHPAYTELVTVLRDRGQVEKFRDLYRDAARPAADHTAERLRRAEA